MSPGRLQAASVMVGLAGVGLAAGTGPAGLWSLVAVLAAGAVVAAPFDRAVGASSTATVAGLTVGTVVAGASWAVPAIVLSAVAAVELIDLAEQSSAVGHPPRADDWRSVIAGTAGATAVSALVVGAASLPVGFGAAGVVLAALLAAGALVAVPGTGAAVRRTRAGD